MVWAVTWMTSSGTTATTFGSAASVALLVGVELRREARDGLAEACRIALTPSRCAGLVDDGRVSVAVAQHDDVAAGGVAERPSDGRGGGVGGWRGSARRLAAGRSGLDRRGLGGAGDGSGGGHRVGAR